MHTCIRVCMCVCPVTYVSDVKTYGADVYRGTSVTNVTGHTDVFHFTEFCVRVCVCVCVLSRMLLMYSTSKCVCVCGCVCVCPVTYVTDVFRFTLTYVFC